MAQSVKMVKKKNREYSEQFRTKNDKKKKNIECLEHFITLVLRT